jgi:hypothetical protein
MRQGNLAFLSAVGLTAVLVTAGGCAFMGESAVHVETGNQTSGFLTRPLTLTSSSDESVQQVAQRICDNVKPGSIAAIAFVGKVPGPDPISFADWGKYRYDCTSAAPVRAAAPVAAPAAVAAPVPAPSMLPAATAPAVPPASSAAPLTDAQEQHRRECQRKLGTYEICLGSCLASSGSSSSVVEGECAQRCAPQSPVGCNP